MAHDKSNLPDQEPVSAIAHDLNNLLQGIRNGTELLRRRLQAADSETNKLIDMVKRNVDSAASLTQQLMTLASRRHAEPVRIGSSSANASAAPADGSRDRLAGLRVLVIEDEWLIAVFVEDLLEQLGCTLVGTFSSVRDGLDTISSADLGLALLDVNVAGEPVYELADALSKRGVPIVFMSGYRQVEERWRTRPSVQKPFCIEQLRAAMERALQG